MTEDTPDPRPPGSGPPAREGSPAPGGGAPVVHTPPGGAAEEVAAGAQGVVDRPQRRHQSEAEQVVGLLRVVHAFLQLVQHVRRASAHELRRLAHGYLRRERKGHTLQTTALINEAYLRLVDQKHVHWANRSHFFGISAQIMRRILIDHARARVSEKRSRLSP